MNKNKSLVIQDVDILSNGILVKVIIIKDKKNLTEIKKFLKMLQVVPYVFEQSEDCNIAHFESYGEFYQHVAWTGAKEGVRVVLLY